MISFSVLVFSAILWLVAERVKGQIDVDYNTCQGTNGNKVHAALAEVFPMAAAAYACTQTLKDGSRSDCHPLSTIFTFETYFGRKLGHYGGALDIVLYALAAVKDVPTMQPPLEAKIYCNDRFIRASTTDEDGQQIPNGGTQYVTRGNPPIWLPKGAVVCRDRPTIGAITLPSLNWIILCPPDLQGPGDSGVRRTQDVSNTIVSIDQDRPISSVLLHELLHVLLTNIMAVMNEAAGFNDCQARAVSSSGSTAAMPDCIALYALSLYSLGNDWSSGRPIPTSIWDQVLGQP